MENFDNGINNNNDETNKNDTGKTFENEQNSPFIVFLNEFLKGVDVNDAINSINKTKQSTSLTDLKKIESTNDANIKFWSRKFFKESFVVLIILICICYLSAINKINDCTIGTLLGSVIGYAIGNFTSSNNNH